ncbi:MAG: ComEC/Rec2 family competence protein [Clostridia bacterium]|nr:ComEC/Rec2 family competence protein [Clostridia bacterium]
MKELIRAGWRLRRPCLLLGVLAFATALAVVWLPLWVRIALGCVAPLLLLWRPCRTLSVLFGLLGGLVLLASALWFRVSVVQPAERLAGQTDTLTGIVERCPVSGHLYTVRVTAAEKLPEDSRVLLYVGEAIAPKLYETVHGEVRFKPLYPSQYSRRADGIYLLAYPTAYGEQSVVLSAEASPLREQWFAALRQGLSARILQVLTGDTGALLTGICLGDLRGLSPAVSDAFRHSGLTHLLVVSGLHLTLLAATLMGLLRVCRVGRFVAASLTMLAVVAFSMLVGFSPSVVRAMVASLVMLAGLLFRRRADGLNSMGLALVLMLAGNPYACLDVGLQLSFAAVTGVLAVAPPIKRALRALLPATPAALWNGLVESVAVTGGATLMVTPLLCVHFGYVSLFTLPANLLTAAPCGWALLLGWVGMLLPSLPLVETLRQAILHLAGALCDWQITVASWFGGAGSTVPMARLWHTALIGGGCWLMAAAVVWGTPRLWRRLACALAAMALTASVATHALSRHAVTVQMVPAEEAVAVLVERQGHYGLLVTHEDALREAEWMLADSPCRTLDFLFVEGVSTSSAGTLQSLLRRTPAVRIYSTDTSWAAGFPHTVHTVQAETPVQLWEDGTATLSAKGGWRLAAGESVLYTSEVRSDRTVYLTTRGNGEWSRIPWR